MDWQCSYQEWYTVTFTFFTNIQFIRLKELPFISVSNWPLQSIGPSLKDTEWISMTFAQSWSLPGHFLQHRQLLRVFSYFEISQHLQHITRMNILGSQMMNPIDFGETDFPSSTSMRLTFVWHLKCLKVWWMACHEICSMHPTSRREKL